MVPNTLICESFALFAKVTLFTCLFAKVSSNCFFTNENEINRLSLQRVWFFYHLFFWASLFRLYSISTNEGITKKIGITFKFETFNLDYHFYMYFRTLYGDFYQSKRKCNASLSCIDFLIFDEEAKKKKIPRRNSHKLCILSKTF